MKITIITVGKLKESYLKSACAEYTKRLSRFCDLDFIEVEDEKAEPTLKSSEELKVKKKKGKEF